MRLAKILALALVLTLAVAGVASAKVRGEVRHVADHAASLLASDQESEAPEAEPSESPETQAADAPETDEAAPADNHGGAVSVVAQSDETATWVNPAGKEITNHGMAVKAVARSKAGMPEKAHKAAGEKGKSAK
jgi:hypothetical protein